MDTRREFACAVLIDTCNRFLLQQRDDIPGIVHPGKIGLFGGHREKGETYRQCVVREIHEELGYLISSESFEYLANYDAKDRQSGNQTIVHGEFFVARDVPVERIRVTEGKLFIANAHELAGLEPRLSPSGQAGLRAYLASGERCCRRVRTVAPAATSPTTGSKITTVVAKKQSVTLIFRASKPVARDI
jgi:8-oxo-dGTP diphosphatase